MKKTRQRNIFFFLVCLVVIFQACQRGVIYQDQRNLPSEGWDYQDGILFEVNIDDTLSLHELYLDVRNTTDYAYSNLFLFLEIEFPDSRTLRDTIECVLADKRGQWTGKGLGHVRANRFLFRDDVWFPKKGVYRFRLYHGMRHELLDGLSDIGVRIEKK